MGASCARAGAAAASQIGTKASMKRRVGRMFLPSLCEKTRSYRPSLGAVKAYRTRTNGKKSRPALRRRRAEEGRKGAAADVIDAGIDDAVADHLRDDRGVKGETIQLAKHHGKVRAMRIAGLLEIRGKLDLGRAVQAAGRELPE